MARSQNLYLAIINKLEEYYKNYDEITKKNEKREKIIETMKRLIDIIADQAYNVIMNDIDYYWESKEQEYIIPIYIWDIIDEEIARMIGDIGDYLGEVRPYLVVATNVSGTSIKEWKPIFHMHSQFKEKLTKIFGDNVIIRIKEGDYEAYIKLCDNIYIMYAFSDNDC